MGPTAPRVLWVSEEVPDRDGGGGAIRQANLVIELAAHLPVDLLVAGRVLDPAVREAANEVVEVAVTDPPPTPAAVRRALVLARQPFEVTAAGPARAALAPAVRRWAPAHDLVVLNHDTLALLLPEVHGALRVAHPHNVGSGRAAQAAALAPSWRTRLLQEAVRRAHRRVERRALEAADVLLTCSDDDARSLLEGRPPRDGLALVTAPNGVDLERFRPTPSPGEQRVLFFGSLDYPPNVDGIAWFVEDVWPRVRAAVAGATLDVVGRSPQAAVRALADRPGVRVTGDVPSSGPWYAGTDVVVVPLRIGTGTRLKALEAMGAGRPVVGTSVGLEGLGLDARDAHGAALVVDDPRTMADTVVQLLRDPARAAQTAAAGRAHVERHYGWPVIGAALAAALTEVAGTARGAR